MATIYDVARHAGVSVSTVSRYFNGIFVSPEKSELVRASAEQLDFRPNRAAGSLRRQHSQLVALLIPDIENPFFTALARGAEDVLQDSGYSLVLCNCDGDGEREARYLDIAVSERMAGVIISPSSPTTDLSALMQRERPVVAIDRAPDGVALDTVSIDSSARGAAATQALVARGFRRIACITGPSTSDVARLRADGWRIAVDGMDGIDDRYLRHADYRVDGGREAMDDLLALPQPPDAVFIASNLMAVGALQSLGAHGMTPPAFGVSLLGSLPYSAIDTHALTMIPMPARELGAEAARLLMDRIRGDKEPARTVIVDHR